MATSARHAARCAGFYGAVSLRPDLAAGSSPAHLREILEAHSCSLDTYVTHEAGTLPIILVSPHGGSAEPGRLQERSESTFPGGPCIGGPFSVERDHDTQELLGYIAEGIYDRTGGWPYRVLGNVGRPYVDYNRDALHTTAGATLPYNGCAFEPSDEAFFYWKSFHDRIAAYVADIAAAGLSEHALLVDIHGFPGGDSYRNAIVVGTGAKTCNAIDQPRTLPNLKQRGADLAFLYDSESGLVPRLYAHANEFVDYEPGDTPGWQRMNTETYAYLAATQGLYFRSLRVIPTPDVPENASYCRPSGSRLPDGGFIHLWYSGLRQAYTGPKIDSLKFEFGDDLRSSFSRLFAFGWLTGVALGDAYLEFIAA